MGTSDGTLLGVTKIVDHGSSAVRWNLVLMGDGYTAAEQAQWQSDAQEVVDYLRTVAPIGDLDIWCGINVYRIDVESDESGTDDPNCDSGGAANTTAATYFDSTLCGDGVIRRLAVHDSSISNDVLDAEVPAWDSGLLIVNSSVRGGGGGSVPTTTTGGADWLDVAVHELGHSAFGLADEYDYWAGCGIDDDRDVAPAGEPTEPNVTTDPNRATIKWAGLIDAATPMPTQPNPDCTSCAPGAAPAGVPDMTVGSFEGAKYFHCGRWRPVFQCKMRVAASEFCPVCAAAIRSIIGPLAPPFVVDLATPTVDFGAVEEGMTIPASVRFDVQSCEPVNFTVLSGPTRTDGGPNDVLDLPSGLTVLSAGPPDIRAAHVWLTLEGRTAGDSISAEMVVRCDETGVEYPIQIVGDVVGRATVGLVLSLDQSGSMTGTTGTGASKADALVDAVDVLVDFLEPDDGIGINTFAADATPGVPVQAAGASPFGPGRIAARGALAAYAPIPGGLTSLGDAITLSDNELIATFGFDTRAMILFTDGVETAPSSLADASAIIGSNPRLFAVGLGTAANINATALSTICGNNDGALLLTGASSLDVFFQLSKYFLQILASVTNSQIVVDPTMTLTSAAVQRSPFYLTQWDRNVDVVMVSEHASAIDFVLETPDGHLITPSSSVPGARFVSGRRSSYYRLSLPVLIDSETEHEGQWHMVTRLNGVVGEVKPKDRRTQKSNQDRVRYMTNVFARSSLTLDVRLSEPALERGQPIEAFVQVLERGRPLKSDHGVSVFIDSGDGDPKLVPLEQVEPGLFQLKHKPRQLGTFNLRFVARGFDSRGSRFTREHAATVFNQQKPVSGVDTKISGGLKLDANLRAELRDLISLGVRDSLRPLLPAVSASVAPSSGEKTDTDMLSAAIELLRRIEK